MTRKSGVAQLDYGSQVKPLRRGCDADLALPPCNVELWMLERALTDKNSLVARHNGWSLLSLGGEIACASSWQAMFPFTLQPIMDVRLTKVMTWRKRHRAFARHFRNLPCSKAYQRIAGAKSGLAWI